MSVHRIRIPACRNDGRVFDEPLFIDGLLNKRQSYPRKIVIANPIGNRKALCWYEVDCAPLYDSCLRRNDGLDCFDVLLWFNLSQDYDTAVV